MKIDPIYNFFIQFLERSSPKKIVSIVTVIALSIFAGGIFARNFIFANWQDYRISVKKTDPKVNKATSPVLGKIRTSRMTVSMKNHSIVQLKKIDVDKAKVERIKKKQFEQLKNFEKWAQANTWDFIHKAHYDWWMFPVERPSSGYGIQYVVGKGEVEAFKADATFMNNYRRGVVLVVQAWGWDLEKGQAISAFNSDIKGQKWTGYGVRLAKMSDSLRLFGEEELHKQLRLFF